MGPLLFDEASHTYTLEGRKMPSVTEVLHEESMRAYAAVDASTLGRAAVLGRAVHRLIELDLQDDLDESSVIAELVDYLTSWRAFRGLSGFECICSEQRVHSERYGYAGTLDLFGSIGRDLVLIDAKRTVVIPRTAGPQTAAYKTALLECPEFSIYAGQMIDRYALHLQPRGKWALIPLKDRSDERVFLAALTLYNWRLK